MLLSALSMVGLAMWPHGFVEHSKVVTFAMHAQLSILSTAHREEYFVASELHVIVLLAIHSSQCGAFCK